MVQHKNWEKNLWVLWFGTFIAGMGFSEVIPFLSLYVSSLGHFGRGELSILSGTVYAATFVVVAVTAPMWGRFADRHGRKRLLLQTTIGSAISLGLMGLVTNVWQLIALRALQGFFAGVIPNATALVAAETPKEKEGYALGIITTGYVGGNLIGPILGGFLASLFSIRITFFITAALLFVSFILSLTMVHESFTPNLEKLKNQPSMFDFHFLREFPNPKIVGWLLFSTIIVQAGLYSIYPIISLFVKELMHGHGSITVVAGIISSLPGIAMFISSPLWGRLGDRLGANKILIYGFIFSIVFYFPQGIITSVIMLGVLRFLVGISNAAIYPVIQTILAKITPSESTGMVFSLNQAAQAVGAVIGSMMGGYISNIFDYSGVFVFTALLLFINLVLLEWRVPEIRKKLG
ncbi:MFS transporter [Apilactobacillus xinyiensis]|uniref:MFS transporter n=1 Tax=Apilactobacillus xinyiensis TaxID=2841032 RepID=A0ABT0I2J2_9LACO|nr:MFS transporter [Apilactobacillus xinyiensis]MCK8624926.1 MFS transporter [Apilactobacillus xinyiensis]MCL0319005.1 MFS transporter [Apilactobacillus xinyiensis]